MTDLGFATGYEQGQETAQAQQLNSLKIQDEQMTLVDHAQTIQQAKALSAAQTKAMQDISAKNGNATVDPGVKLQQLGESLLSQFPVQAEEYIKKGQDLQAKNVEIVEKQTKQTREDLQLAINLGQGVHDSASAQDAIMQFRTLSPTSHPELDKIFQQLTSGPYDQGKWDRFMGSLTKASDKVETDLKKAQTAKDNADARSATYEPALKQAQTEAARSLAAARAKAGTKPPSGYEWDTTKDVPTLKPIPGGKADAKAQEKVAEDNATLKVATSQIDELLGLLDKHSAVTGAVGAVRRGGEWVYSSFGGKDIPATDIADKMAFIQAQVPQWMELGKRSGADQRKLLVDAVSGLQHMTSGEQAKTKLKNLKSVLTAIYSKGESSGEGKVEETRKLGGKTYVKIDGKWNEQ